MSGASSATPGASPRVPGPGGPEGPGRPGWYPDPWRLAPWRWWDGLRWTPAVGGLPLTQLAPPPAPPAAQRTAESQRAATVTDQALRRRLGWETLIVLAIFPLPYVINALISITQSIIAPKVAQNRFPDLIEGHQSASLIFYIAATLVTVAAAALVLYLLTLSDGGPAAIGLVWRRWRGDLAMVLLVLGVAFLAAQYGAGIIITALHIHSPAPAIGPTSALAAAAGVAASVSAGVVEEVVVLGYLVRRLEQRGWAAHWVVVVAVLVRVSYHVYYGWGVLPIIAWATVSVLIYRRYRRLLPFVIAHFLWDTTVFLGQLYGHRFVLPAVAVVAAATITCTALWWSRVELDG